jgi:tRNA pseudouridine55 synthase
MTGPDGIFLFDKPGGMTSHDVVARARRWFNTRAIGHAGTLDPMATGLLILCVNAATRMSEYLLGQDKAYAARIQLGAATNTDDAEGEVISEAPVAPIDAAQLRALEAQFSGRIQQIPPQFSAIKKDGKRAYALARAGETVALVAREVVIERLTLTLDDTDPRVLTASVDCGSGTYIRSLARDIGQTLGCGAHLSALRRLRIGRFQLTDAVDEITMNTLAGQGRATDVLQPMDRALAAQPELRLDAEQSRRLHLGQRLTVTAAAAALVRVYDDHSRFSAVAEIENGVLRPIKVFHS